MKIPIEVRAYAATEALLQAQRLGRAMKSAAPKDTGAVAASVRVEGGRNSGERFYVKAGGPSTTRPVREGADASFDYATASEWGTVKEPARPWFFATWRAYRPSIRKGMESTIKKAVAQFNGKGTE
jgi:HK97 gp10 family phage protein